MHIANIFMSLLTSGRFSVKLDPTVVQGAVRLLRREDAPYVPNPCSFYLLNLAIDVSLEPFLSSKYDIIEANPCMCVVSLDHHRYSYLDSPSSREYRSYLLHTMGQTTRVDTVWQLWQSTKSVVVAKAVFYLF
jgi:hypothetical protein